MKKFLILICLIFLTGCKVKYTIDFDGEYINDNLSVSDIDSEAYDFIKKGEYAPVPVFKNDAENLEEPVKNDGVVYYDMTGKDGNAYLTHKFKLADFESSNFVNTCYDYFKIFQENNEIIFSTGKKFKCFFPGYNLERVDVIIKTNHKVLYNNADEVSDDKYIWHITEDNKNNANIQISFSKDYKKTRVKINYLRVLTYVGIGGAFIFLITLYVLIRNKRVNRI